MFSKSLGYTRLNDFDNYACLLLSEVALGNQYKLTNADYNIDDNKIKCLGYDSTYGMGNTSLELKYKTKNMIIPGNIIKTNLNSSLLYDEFIVYNPKQIKQKYLIIIKNN